jgi:hypothetical protein
MCPTFLAPPRMPHDAPQRTSTKDIHRSAWRNCLENRYGSPIRSPKASTSTRRGADRPALDGKNACSRSLRLFSKQFRKGDSQKFAGDALQTLGLERRI